MSDDQFTKLSKQIDEVKDDLGNQILKLYQHTEQRFDELEAKLDTKADRAQVEKLQVAVDRIASRLDIDDAERAAVSSKVDRHERWINQAAPKLGAKYDAAA